MTARDKVFWFCCGVNTATFFTVGIPMFLRWVSE